jgi:NADH-quinone oxidoreductase subunit H
MDIWDIIIVAIRVVVAFVLPLTVVVFLVWGERKIVSDMQNRIGPNRAGPWGILQTVADGLKLFFKESITPRKVEYLLYMAAPAIAVMTAFMTFLVVPWGEGFTWTINGEPHEFAMVGADLNIGVLFLLAMSSVAVYGIVLAGWSSGSKYPLLGGVRATAQAISYEAAMGLAIVSVILFMSTTSTEGGTMSLVEIVERQRGGWGEVVGFLGPLGAIPRWNILPQFIAFVIFMIAAVAETNRAPFDLVEAEQELVGGFHTEYSGFRFALFFLAEYANMFNMSAIAVTLFLGGWDGPTFDRWLPAFIAGLMPLFWFLLKTAFVLFLYVWIRATWPRLRYDQLMTLGWKRLIPAALVWLIASTLVVSVRQFGLPWA